MRGEKITKKGKKGESLKREVEGGFPPVSPDKHALPGGLASGGKRITAAKGEKAQLDKKKRKKRNFSWGR